MEELVSLLKQAFETFSAFKDVGLLAGLALLINLLVNVTKLSVVEKWLSGVKAVRPLIAVGLGLAGGLVTAMVQGKSFVEAVMMVATGVVAGAGAISLHELVQALKPVWSWVAGKLGLAQ